jgi:hypothetical protein
MGSAVKMRADVSPPSFLDKKMEYLNDAINCGSWGTNVA